MRRREFIGLVGGTALSPLLAYAKQGAGNPVVGILSSGSEATTPEGIRFGLEEAGYFEGRNLKIVSRWSDGHYERLPALAEELLKVGVSVIIAGDLPATLAARVATKTTPIVFIMGADPVTQGIVENLNRPGGNTTGLSQVLGIVGGKRLELLREVMPNPGLIALLTNPRNPNMRDNLGMVLEAARRIGQPVEAFSASTDLEIDAAFAAVVASGARGLQILDDPVFRTQGNQLVRLAAQRAIPTIYYARSFTLAGGLISYGSNVRDNYRQVGIYAGRILQGVKPADLPVIQPAKFELSINLKTAKDLGITVPPMLLSRADEVIE